MCLPVTEGKNGLHTGEMAPTDFTLLLSYCESVEAGISGTTPRISQFKKLMKEKLEHLCIIVLF